MTNGWAIERKEAISIVESLSVRAVVLCWWCFLKINTNLSVFLRKWVADRDTQLHGCIRVRLVCLLFLLSSFLVLLLWLVGGVGGGGSVCLQMHLEWPHTNTHTGLGRKAKKFQISLYRSIKLAVLHSCAHTITQTHTYSLDIGWADGGADSLQLVITHGDAHN